MSEKDIIGVLILAFIIGSMIIVSLINPKRS